MLKVDCLKIIYKTLFRFKKKSKINNLFQMILKYFIKFKKNINNN